MKINIPPLIEQKESKAGQTAKEIVFGSKRRFIVGFGGMAVMVVTTVCGAVIMIALDDAAGGSLPYGGAFHAIYGGAIGAVVGLPIWGLLGYMVYRKIAWLYITCFLSCCVMVVTVGVIGAVVGLPIWGLLGYMVYRKKNAPPNEIIPDDTTT